MFRCLRWESFWAVKMYGRVEIVKSLSLFKTSRSYRQQSFASFNFYNTQIEIYF